MKIKKKLIALSTSLILTGSLLTGCGSSNSTTGKAVNENTIVFDNTSLTGTVTAVDGSTITLSLTSGREMGGGMNGDMKGNMQQGDNPPDQQSGNNENQIPDGNAPDNTDSNNDNEPTDNTDNNNNNEPPDKPGNANSDNTSSDDSSDIDGANENSGNPAEKSENLSENFEQNSTTFLLTIVDESVLQDITLSDITEGTLLTITFGNDNTITSITTTASESGAPEGGADDGGNSGSVNTGTGATTITQDTQESSISYVSESEDENALRVEGTVNYSGTGLTIQKNAGETSDTESSDFYGLNAGFLSLDGATTTLTDSVVTTSAQGANGIFAYGSGTSVTVSNTSITTTADNSGGIDVTGGASIQATNLSIATNGQSSAAIRSDRGGGTLNVSQGTYVTNGTGSPAVYCTADVTVSDATLTATASEGVVIEGKNSVTLKDCDVTGNMQGTYQGDENENLHTIMIYQSMSGDAEEGEAVLSVTGGSITGQNGDLLYSTNTSSTVTLENVALTLANDTLLRVSGNDGSRGWGQFGSNGADMKLTAINQILNGKIIVDEISSLTLSLSEESTFEGSINEEQEGGNVTVTLEDNSTWKLTADSYITSFDGSLDNVDTNGYTLYVNGVAQN